MRRLAIAAVLLLAACGGSDSAPPVPARCKDAWANLVKTGAAKDGAELRERVTLACDGISDLDLWCAANADTAQALRDGCPAVIRAVKAGSKCRQALRHAADLGGNDKLTGAERTKFDEQLERGIEKCEAGHVPESVLDCSIAATTVEDVARCAALK